LKEEVSSVEAVSSDLEGRIYYMRFSNGMIKWGVYKKFIYERSIGPASTISPITMGQR